MYVFDFNRYQKLLMIPEIVALIGEIREYKGRQELYETAHADILTSLLKIAKIQSTDASNRIEGVVVEKARLKALMSKSTAPMNRNEQEIAGYRDVLNTIHESYEFIPIRPSYILQLHRDLYGMMAEGVGGHWKLTDNIIQETDVNGDVFVRFRPTPAVETEGAMTTLCDSYRQLIGESKIERILLAILFVFDFLCIHPFHDGNGRMSRLMTLLLLYQNKFIVGKYISLEKIIEESKETYYEALQKSSTGWQDQQNDPVPFVSYMLGVVLKAYRELSSRVEGLIDFKKPKGERIKDLFENNYVPMLKSEIAERCPDISLGMITLTLQRLLSEKYIEKTGQGRGTRYVRTRQ